MALFELIVVVTLELSAPLSRWLGSAIIAAILLFTPQPKLLCEELPRLVSLFCDQSGQCGTAAEARVMTTRTVPALT